MLLDILYLVLLIIAIVKGFQRGLIVGIFSFLAVVIGLAAAMKLSTLMAVYLGNNTSVSKQWLPFLSFTLVFIGVVLLVRLGANLLQKGVALVTLGWLDKLGGILLYVLLYTFVYSVVLFYGVQLHLVKDKTIEDSVCYAYISPLGPWVINAFATVLPFFRDMFSDLQHFFGGMAGDIPAAHP